MGRGMTASIVKLTDGVKYIAEGDLDKKVEVYSRDEVEDLANAFNKMTDDLKTYIKNLRETTAAKERIESELKIAHDIQTSMLPRIFPPFPDRKEFDIFATMAPAKEVGGDFYDFFLIDENKLCFLIGDVSGKGVPAALFMVISKTLLKTEALRDSSPDKVLFEVNNILFPDNDACMFATVFCVILNIETGELQFANAGHNPPLLCLDGKDFEFIKVKKGFVIGGMENTKFVSEKITLKPGDIFFLYTDGVTEAKNPENQLFSDERLKQILSNLKGKDVTEIIQEVRAEVDTFAQGTPQFDDITMLALKFNSPYAST
jgi:sigma-B regulation protein RsbU (phosphoserine phosphatase)